MHKMKNAVVLEKKKLLNLNFVRNMCRYDEDLSPDHKDG